MFNMKPCHDIMNLEQNPAPNSQSLLVPWCSSNSLPVFILKTTQMQCRASQLRRFISILRFFHCSLFFSFLLDVLLATSISPTHCVVSSPKSVHFLRIRFWAGPCDAFQQQPRIYGGSGPSVGWQQRMCTHSQGVAPPLSVHPRPGLSWSEPSIQSSLLTLSASFFPAP